MFRSHIEQPSYGGDGCSICDDMLLGHLRKNMYTSTMVTELVMAKYDVYYAKLAVGQSENWKCDKRAADLFIIQNWLIDEFITNNVNNDDRLDSQYYFNRKARSEEDLFELAARTLNKCMNNDIERFRRK